MLNLDLSPDMQDAVQDAARAATLAAARAFGFGGSTWERLRPSGSGAGPRTLPGSGPTVTALAWRQRPSPRALAEPGAVVGDELWRIAVLDGDVRPKDVLRSRLNGQMVRVATLEAWYEYERGELEEYR